MSRRSNHFRKLMRQAGADSPARFFPQSKSRDRKNQVITEPMTEAKRQRLTALLDPKRRK